MTEPHGQISYLPEIIVIIIDSWTRVGMASASSARFWDADFSPSVVLS